MRTPKDPEHESPYAVLNVSPDASDEEIIAAYRKMAQMYHPDKVAGLAPEFRELAEQRMKAINIAYEQLTKKGRQNLGETVHESPAPKPTAQTHPNVTDSYQRWVLPEVKEMRLFRLWRENPATNFTNYTKWRRIRKIRVIRGKDSRSIR